MLIATVQVQFKWNSVYTQRRGKEHAVLKRHGRIFPGMPQRTRRRVWPDMQVRREHIQRFERWILTGQIAHRTDVHKRPLRRNHGVAHNAKVGPQRYVALIGMPSDQSL